MVSPGRLQKRIPLLYRAVVLRIILMSTTAVFLINVSRFAGLEVSSWRSGWFQVVAPPLIILHHILRLWQRERWLVLYELLTSFLEIFAVILMSIGYPPAIQGEHSDGSVPISQPSPLWGPFSAMLAFCFISLVILFCDILQTVQYRNHMLCSYDFSMGLCGPGRQWRFVFGDATTRRRYSTDNYFIRWVRGGVAILILLGMVCLVFYASIWQPLQWSDQPGVKTFKRPVVKCLAQTLNVTLGGRWTDTHGWPFQVVLPAREVRSFNPTVDAQLPTINASLPFAALRCNHTQTLFEDVILSCLIPHFPPQFNEESFDILLTVDFSLMQDNFRAYLASTQTIETMTDMVTAAEPIGISPGQHLFGWSSFKVIERFANQNAATFGITRYRSLAVINLNGVSPDWQPPLQMDNNAATIRIRVQSQQEIEIEQEYLEGSVLNGFALVGGIWTFVSGAFAAIFGTTLLLILLGIKPLSIYGLLHYFQLGKGSLVGEGSTLSPEERDRILGILKEHLLDKGEIEGDKNSLSPGSPAGALSQSNHSRGDVEAQI